MRWWPAALAVLLSRGCTPVPAYAAPFSTTGWEASHIAFAEAVAAYFDQAVYCRQQRRQPSPGLMRNEVLGFIEAQERWWPGRLDYRERLFTVMVSEGGGLPGGNPDDPSYGVMHITYATARHAATFFNLGGPKRERDFIARLQEDSRFCIRVAAGALFILEWGFGGDWLRAVGAYKCGPARWAGLVRDNPEVPVTELKVIKTTLARQRFFECVAAYALLGTRMKDCQCLAGQP